MLATTEPGHRLITQNLLISAVTFEREKQVSISSLQDLSVLIDLFCLYDRTVVLGRSSSVPFRESELMSKLDEHFFVEVEEPGTERIEAITLTAQKHLATFLGLDDVEKYQGLLRYALSPHEATYAIMSRADGMTGIRLGREWLLTASGRANLLRLLEEENDVARGTTFLVRTFLYLAYADIARLAFTPDAVRCPVLDDILKDEDKFLRQALVSRFQSAWQHHPTSGYQELRRTVSPFAAMIFERAKSRSEIASQMERLRNELAPLRERVHKLEEKALWGNWQEAVDAERKWQQALAEIETNFGPDPHLVSIKRAIRFGESIGGVIDKPTSWTNWLSLLGKVPLEIATRLVSQRPAIEIHRLRPELPGPGRLAKSVERLFGPVH